MLGCYLLVGACLDLFGVRGCSGLLPMLGSCLELWSRRRGILQGVLLGCIGSLVCRVAAVRGLGRFPLLGYVAV